MSKPKFTGIAEQTGFQTQQNCNFVTLAPDGGPMNRIATLAAPTERLQAERAWIDLDRKSVV